MKNSESSGENDASVYWLMQITLDDGSLVADYIDHLSLENPANAVGYRDREGDSETLKIAQRKLFFEEMKVGDQIIVLRGSNEVICLAEITGNAKELSTDDLAEQDWFYYSRSVSVQHKFEFPFRTIAHLHGPPIIRANGDRSVALLVKEVTEAASGNGFTVDWSHLVNLW